MENTATTNNVIELRYFPGGGKMVFNAVTLLPTADCLRIYGTNDSFSSEEVIEALKKRIKTERGLEIPSHLRCGDDDVWCIGRDQRVFNLNRFVKDLEANEDAITTTQAGILIDLFPQLAKGVMIQMARAEVRYGVSNPNFVPHTAAKGAVRQWDSNQHSAGLIIEDLNCVDDGLEQTLPVTFGDFSSIRSEKTRTSLENLMGAMETTFSYQVDRPGAPVFDCGW